MWKKAWKDFKSSRLNTVGLGIVILYTLISILAPFLAPYSPRQQFNAPNGQYTPLPPGSHSREGAYFILGSDQFGRDLLSRLIFGVRVTMQIALGVVLFSVFAGILLGSLAGYYNGTWIDELIMRVMDIFISFPSLILAIAVIGIIGRGSVTIGPLHVPEVAKIIFAIGIGYIPRFARVTRSGVLAEAEEDYVLASQSIGKPAIKIIFGDILPNVIPPVLVQASLRTATAIIIAAGLSFLGLGVSPPTPSLGLILANARDFIMIGVWWLPVFPGLAIMILCLGLNLLGDGLRNIIDPTHRELATGPATRT